MRQLARLRWRRSRTVVINNDLPPRRRRVGYGLMGVVRPDRSRSSPLAVAHVAIIWKYDARQFISLSATQPIAATIAAGAVHWIVPLSPPDGPMSGVFSVAH